MIEGAIGHKDHLSYDEEGRIVFHVPDDMNKTRSLYTRDPIVREIVDSHKRALDLRTRYGVIGLLWDARGSDMIVSPEDIGLSVQ